MIQVSVAGMILDEHTRGPILLLHVPPVNKYLPIWIGTSEAAAIGLALQKEQFERPLTHDLLMTVIDGLDGRLSRVVITEQRGDTYFAKMYIERGPQVIGIDARPSDSVALALRGEAPIFVVEEVVSAVKDRLLTLDEKSTRDLYGWPRKTDEHEADSEGDED